MPPHNSLVLRFTAQGWGAFWRQTLTAKVDNLRVYAEDAVDVLTHCLAPDSVDAFHVFFPDPWHKKKHHKRRLIQTDLVRPVVSATSSGRLRTPLQRTGSPYVEQMFDVLRG
jgi:tRNA (guanine-N7-)-methyltransferase